LSGYDFYKSDNIEFVFINNEVINFREHCHASVFSMTLITEGVAELKKTNLNFNLYAGSMAVLKPYENHSLISKHPVRLITMCVKKEVIYNMKFACFQKLIIKSLNAISRKHDFFKNHFSHFYLTALNVYLMHYGKSQDGKINIEISRKKIEAKPEYNCKIGKFADGISISKFHYIREFKKISGLTPHKFQIQNRIRKAQKLLSTGITVAETATMTGFFDQSHFDKYFKRIVGIAPSEYIISISNFLQAIK